MAIITTTDADFTEKVIQSQTPVLVDFWAVWCGPCKMAEPVLEELSEAYQDKLIIAKINVDENLKTTENFTVLSIPTAILFANGKELGRQVGFAGKEAYESLIKKIIP